MTIVAHPALEQHGGWPGVLNTLTTCDDLTVAQAHAAMTEILAGNTTSAQIAGFLVALRMKGESLDELAGFLAAMDENSVLVELAELDDVVDIVGTGGDQSHSINVSTLASIVAASAGARVCKHGNRAASSSCGAADVLEALGVVIDLGPTGVAHCVERAGIGFCFAPRYHPAMRHAGPTRRELGVPTVFNVLGPLANPARVRRQLIGVADPGRAERMARVLASRGAQHVLIVYGHDGLDELTTTTTSTVVELHGGDVRRYDIDPSAFGLARVGLAELRGGDAARSSDIAKRVLNGERGPARDIVVLNGGAGLVAAGKADDLASGIERAASAIDEGHAASTLADFVAASHDVE